MQYGRSVQGVCACSPDMHGPSYKCCVCIHTCYLMHDCIACEGVIVYLNLNMLPLHSIGLHYTIPMATQNGGIQFASDIKGYNILQSRFN